MTLLRYSSQSVGCNYILRSQRTTGYGPGEGIHSGVGQQKKGEENICCSMTESPFALHATTRRAAPCPTFRALPASSCLSSHVSSSSNSLELLSPYVGFLRTTTVFPLGFSWSVWWFSCLHEAVVAREGNSDKRRTRQEVLQVQGPAEVHRPERAGRYLLPLRRHAERQRGFL